MKQGQGFLLVYSIASKSSFQELAELRESIIRIKDDDDIPIVLVGNKNDMPREDREVEKMDALRVVERWGQKPFFEVSAKRDHLRLIEEPFLNLCRQILAKDNAREQLYEQQYPTGRQPVYHRHDTRQRRRPRKRDRCVIL